MMNNTCANCTKVFPKKDKGYERFSLDRKLPRSDVSALQALSTMTVSYFTPIKSARSGNFLCASCWSSLSNLYLYKESSKRFWGETKDSSYVGQKISAEDKVSFERPSTSTPVRESSTCAKRSLFSRRLSSTGKGKHSKWDTIAGAVKSRHYGRAIRALYNATKGSRKEFHTFVKSVIRREVTAILKSGFPLCQEPSVKNIQDFSWEETIQQLQTTAPMLADVLVSTLTTPSNETTLCRGKAKSVNLKPYIGCALACLLHARKPRTCRLMQTVFSLQFWQGGLKRETMNQMHRTGTCLAYNSTLKVIDAIREGFDDAARRFKEDLELQLSSPTDYCVEQQDKELAVALSSFADLPVLSDEEVSITSDDGRSSSTESSEEEKPASLSESSAGSESAMAEMVISTAEGCVIPAQNVLHPGFTFCWDNVGKKVTTRHPTSTTSNNYINVALAYMTVNRVPSTHLDATGASVKSAVNIPFDVFIPTQEDFTEVRERQSVLVGRMLTRHLHWFKDNFSDCVVQHLLHEHSAESSQRSVLVNLGVFDENPSTTQGAIKIYERLQAYVPKVENKPYPTVVFGDGFSCERGNDAIKARSNGLNPWERLEGFEPAAQEFHKEMILLQDHFDDFFKPSSAAEKGTMFHLKTYATIGK